MMTIEKTVAVALIAAALSGCQPAEPPPDLLKTQREGLNKAKAVEGQVLQQADEQRKAAENAEK
jgi:hypothetical protein